MAALVVAAMAMVFVSVSCPLSGSRSLQGAPSPAQSKERPVKCVCERVCVNDCVLMVWCVLVRILVTAGKHVGRPDMRAGR